MKRGFVDSVKLKIVMRALPRGGFPSRTPGEYRPDATAWAILALIAAGDEDNLVNSARSRLAETQMDDGRVSLSKNYAHAFWPTALAVLAWNHSPAHSKSQLQATNFLLKTAGRHPQRKKNSPVAHDPALRGWPWIEDTHSWVEPTSLVLLALMTMGKGDHERAEEARLMLLDRQLESGGWNYGNSAMFGRPLRPMPESTGLALSALAGNTTRNSVEKSISYLKREMNRLKTPLSFSWGFLGLSSWGERVQIQQASLVESFWRRETYGSYCTEELSLVMICCHAEFGILRLFDSSGPK